MRKIIVLLVVLLAVPVFAQQICDPSGVLDQGEECDPGTGIGDAVDYMCPGMCQSDCTCAQESSFVLFDLAMGHNLLFSKVQDLLHVIKNMLIQLEFKTIEIQLTDFNCSQQPVSFWIPAQYSPYGKLNEIDGLLKLTIQSLQKGEDDGGDFGPVDLVSATDHLDKAELCLANGYYRTAFDCKCVAYRVDLLGLDDDVGACEDPSCGPQ